MRPAGFLLASALLAAGACTSPPERPRQEARQVASTLSAGPGRSDEGFARAIGPREFSFPEDHGPHPAFRTEWWYVTGNLATEDGRPFGFQWTVFRQALAPRIEARASRWATRDVYLGHFALSDLAERESGFRSFERFRRGALGLAEAVAEPLAVRLDDWSLESVPAAAGEPARTPWPARLRAEGGRGDDARAIDLRLGEGVPPVLQGDRGLSKKGPAPGNASYYYSLPRMPARGEVRIGSQKFRVSGLAWLDREWSTSGLAPGLVGWDWFALQLDDGYSLMLYRLRGRDGSASPESRGALIAPDGSTRTLEWRDLAFEQTASWTSPKSGAVYPAAWRIRIAREDLDLAVTPRLADQELDGAFRYWEGAVAASGKRAGRPVGGQGYVELTGYADAAPPPR